jgi:hypothetical protein
LADFLFNVREGHCEYFATAMAIMLRTQGIATRVVNGFHGGEYNDAAGLTVVRQRHAHAWVEVYFPGKDVWVTFDPTPAAGQPGNRAPGGVAATLGKYVEALEALWIQYFVAFDDQEQRSMGRSVRREFLTYQERVASYLGKAGDAASSWLADVRGDKGVQARATAVGYTAAAALGAGMIIWLLILGVRKLAASSIFHRSWRRLRRSPSIVEFYDRMIRLMESRGFRRAKHQTPLEFAVATGNDDALALTLLYQKVRFGGHQASPNEVAEIEKLLHRISQTREE